MKTRVSLKYIVTGCRYEHSRIKLTESTSYTLSCTIPTSNPKPVTKYEWFKNDKEIFNEGPVHLCDPVERKNAGSWICQGIINQNSIIIEKNSTTIQVNTFCN